MLITRKAPGGVWHTGKYNIQTDRFDGGFIACFSYDGWRVLQAEDREKLEKAFAEDMAQKLR